MGRRVLVVDDEAEVVDLVCATLKSAGGYECFSAPSGHAALELSQSCKPHIVILDLGLPDMDGLELCRRLHGPDDATRPVIIVLTAHGDLPTRIAVFHQGADDYMVKPFAPSELVCRMEALVRRAQGGAGTERVCAAGNEIRKDLDAVRYDQASDVIYAGQKPLRDLAPKEKEILKLLIERAPAVVSRSEIYRKVWGGKFAKSNRTVDVHVGRIRAKMGVLGYRLCTAEGDGYSLA